MKKALSLLLAVLLFAAVLPIGVFAATESTTYNINSTSFGGDASEHVTYVVQSDFLRLDVNGATAQEAGLPVKGLYGTVVISVAEAGEYDVTLNLRAHESCGNFELYINGSETKQCNVDMRHSVIGKPANSFFDLEIGKVTLVKGENTFKFVSTGEGGTKTTEDNRYKANIRRITIERETTYESFSAGTITETAVGSAITQEIESGYTFVNELGETAEKTFSSSSTAGYGKNMAVFYDVMAGSYFEYTVNVETAGTYHFSINSRTHMTGFGEFTLSVDGETMGSYMNKASSNSSTMWAEYSLGTIALTQGEHKVRFTATGEGPMAYSKENNNCFGADLFTMSPVVTDYTIASEDFSAFVSSRKASDDKHDLRFIVAADFVGLDNYDALYMTVSFLDADGNTVKSIVKNVATELSFYASATAAGNRYTAAEGSVLFGMVITNVPDSAWASATVSLSTAPDTAPAIKGTVSATAAIG
ncbi:MAG: carbohydrate-binding protein [Clostridia bacterium]|nr:carbohydrate-binding protein [Clostridia bacterium]